MFRAGMPLIAALLCSAQLFRARGDRTPRQAAYS